MAQTQIPEKLVNFRCYGGTGASEFFGLADVELPKFEAMTETIHGAGIAGEYESPVLGHFKSMVAKLNLRTPTALALSLLAPVVHKLDVYGSIQILDPMRGVLTTQALRVQLLGEVKGLDVGKLEPGKPMATAAEVEITKIVISLAGVVVVEFDRFNFVYKVNGVDYLAPVRTDLGG